MSKATGEGAFDETVLATNPHTRRPMSESEKHNLENMIGDISRTLKQAKQALSDESMVIFFSSLKTIHNMTTKAKNVTVDIALAHMDGID